MITYSDLYEALRKEKYNEKLQKLPRNFLTQLGTYFKEKKEIASKEDDMFSEEIAKTKKQLENAKMIIKELMMIREKKILSLGLVAAKIGVDKRDVENMLDYENDLLDTVTKKIEKNGKQLKHILQGQGTETQKKDLKNQLVRFTQDTPEFLGLNGNSLGPFKRGDVANLPKEIIKILIGSNKVASIDAN